MTIKGELKDIKLADIFQMVAMQQQEGTLLVTDGETKKWLYFSHDGMSLLSSGKRRPTPLGQLLLRAGRITEKQLEEALSVWRRTGKRLGEVLCDFGLTTQEEIEEVVQEQIAEEIYDMLDWQGTTFEFIPGPPPDEFSQGRGDRRSASFDVNAILLEAARRADEWDKLEREIGSINEIFVRNKVKGASADLEGDALSVYPLIDGSRTVHEIVAALRLPKAGVARAILALLEIGLIRPATREEVMRLTAMPGVEEHGDRLACLLELATIREEDPELRKRLAGVYEGLGRRIDAANHYRRLAHIYTEQYKLAEAAEALREATRLIPEDTETREQLVELYIRLTNIPHAVLHLKRLAKQHMDNLSKAKALAAYRRALELAPYDYECRKQAVDMLIEIRDVDSALDECIKLESAATTQLERDEVRDRYGRVLALAPNLAEARRRLAGLTEAERQKVRSRRVSRRAIVVLSMLLISASIAVGYFYWTQKYWQRIEAQVDDLWKKGEYKKAQALLDRHDSERAAQLREALDARERKEKETRDRRLEQIESNAKAREREGQFPAAAKIYRDLADELEHMEGSDGFKIWKLREDARKLEEKWDQARDEKKIAEEMAQAGQCREAHERIARLVGRSPDLSRALGIRLPISVRSIPAGALLTVDNLPFGEAPKIVYKQPGSPIRIAFDKSGHQVQTRSVLDDSAWELEVTLPRTRMWELRTGSAIEVKPVYDNGRLYVGSRDGTLYVLDSTTGKVIWRFAASGDIMTTPALLNGLVYFGTNNGVFYAVDAQTHQEKWSKKIRGFIRSAPAIAPSSATRGKDMVLFGASDTWLYALEAATGKAAWTFQASQAIETGPCVSGGAVFITDDNGYLYALQLSDGSKNWEYRANAPIYTIPLARQGRVIVGTEEGTVVAVDATTGAQVWSYTCGGKILTSGAADEFNAYMGCQDNSLHAIDLKTGEMKWRFSAAAPITSPPTLDDRTLYVGSGDGNFYAIDCNDGTIRWQTLVEANSGNGGAAIRAPAGFSEDAVFVGADSHCVYAFKR